MNHIGAQKKNNASLHASIKQERMKVSCSAGKYTRPGHLGILVDQCSFSVP